VTRAAVGSAQYSFFQRQVSWYVIDRNGSIACGTCAL
jgi:hypothetical protein